MKIAHETISIELSEREVKMVLQEYHAMVYGEKEGVKDFRTRFPNIYELLNSLEACKSNKQKVVTHQTDTWIKIN